MGVGKTIEILALVLSNKAPASGPGNTPPGAVLPEEEEGDGLQEDAEGGTLTLG